MLVNLHAMLYLTSCLCESDCECFAVKDDGCIAELPTAGRSLSGHHGQSQLDWLLKYSLTCKWTRKKGIQSTQQMGLLRTICKLML